MPGPVLQSPLPRVQQALGYDPTLPAPWTQPESVTDSALTKAMRMISGLLGTDDPGSQLMGIAGAMEVPGAEGALSKAIAGLTKRIRAYHGSPHDFDRFSLEKIGTGEGAQAYGHGLYFAEDEAVAKSYRDDLTHRPITLSDGKPLSREQERILSYLSDRNIPIDDSTVLSVGDAMLADPTPKPRTQETWQKWQQAWEDLRPRLSQTEKPGRMYEVEINADPSDFLDWDKPLSQQSEKVKAALAKAGIEPKPARPGPPNAAWDAMGGGPLQPFDPPGAQVAPGMESKLREQGVAGIKYLDGMSRGAANVNDLRGTVSMWAREVRKAPNDDYARQMLQQAEAELAEASKPLTSNYVVFDDKLISILRKYGVAGAVGAGYTLQQIQQAQGEAR